MDVQPTVLHLNIKVVGFLANKYVVHLLNASPKGRRSDSFFSLFFCSEPLACSHADNYACLFLLLQFLFLAVSDTSQALTSVVNVIHDE